jgi:PLD-like domain
VNNKKVISGIEFTSIGLSIIGSIAAAITQQIAYVATPVTLSLSISLVNRQKEELARANHHLAKLEQQFTSEIKSVRAQAQIDRDSLTAPTLAPTMTDFQNLQTSILANRQQVDRLERVILNLEQKDSDLAPFLTEIDLTRDSLRQLSLNFSNFEKEFHHPQDSTRVVTVEPMLVEFRESDRYKIVEIIEAVVTDLKFSTLIQQEVDRSSQAQFEIFKKLLPKQYTYDPVVGREQSRQLFLDALVRSQERLILVCPWLTNYAIDGDVRCLIMAALTRGVSIDIGWGHLKDVANDRTRLSKEELLSSKNNYLYNAVPWLYKLQDDYKDLLTLKVLGTHEKFLVCDRKFAMIGSHNYMTSSANSSERELGFKTDSPETIDKLIKLFERGGLQ